MSQHYDPSMEPRLFDGGGDITKRWYIDYRIWDTDKGQFVRKQYTGMNKYPTKTQRMKVAKQKLQEIRDLLAQGYTAGKSTVVDQTASRFDLKHFTLRQALTHFCNCKNATTGNDSLNVLEEKYNEQGARISFNTHKDYKTTRKLVLEWLERDKMPGLLVINFNRQACDLFFTYLKEERGVGNKTYNKYRGYLSTVINYYIEHLELLIKNPVAKVEHLRVVESDMHEPVRVEHLQRIRKHLLEKGDKQLFLFVKFLYYTFTRPNEEIRRLQVKDIREKTIFIPSSRAKNNRGEHIGIPVALEKLIQEYKLRDLPPDYYVFSNNGQPGEKLVGGRYFYRKHIKLLQELKLDKYNYTLYGYKHTGAITLYEQTKDILAVKNHCRHTSSAQTDTYLRKYGAMLNEKAIQLREF